MNITSTIDLTPYNIKEGKSKLMFTLSTLFWYLYWNSVFLLWTIDIER
jgi:hypothetical protein